MFHESWLVPLAASVAGMLVFADAASAQMQYRVPGMGGARGSYSSGSASSGDSRELGARVFHAFVQ